ASLSAVSTFFVTNISSRPSNVYVNRASALPISDRIMTDIARSIGVHATGATIDWCYATRIATSGREAFGGTGLCPFWRKNLTCSAKPSQNGYGSLHNDKKENSKTGGLHGAAGAWHACAG